MRKNNNIYKVWHINILLELIGLATLATIAHEAYHWFTVKEPIEMCIDKHGAITRYIGGTTSEIVAYSITFIIMVVGSFIIFKYRK